MLVESNTEKYITHLFFDDLGTFANGIPTHCTLSAAKTGHNEHQVVWASGEYPELERQGELMSYMLSEKRAGQREQWCIHIVLAVRSDSFPCRAWAGLQYWHLQSPPLLPLHQKLMLALMLALLAWQLSLMTRAWGLLNSESWASASSVGDPDTWEEQILLPLVLISKATAAEHEK